VPVDVSSRGVLVNVSGRSEFEIGSPKQGCGVMCVHNSAAQKKDRLSEITLGKIGKNHRQLERGMSE
jgi:hypothetical protein